MSKPDSLNSDKIKANLKTKRIGKEVIVYDSTSSTNDIAAEYAKNRKNDGLVIFAEEQTVGRGRAGNKWLSGRADSILCSILLTDCSLNGELLSLACAVATAETIGKLGPTHAKIKWPNDIILNGKKLAGILLESKVDNGSISYIIGIGINCHQKKDSFPEELQQITTSIDIESDSFTDRISLAKRLLTSIDHWLDIAGKNSAKVTKHWRKLSFQLGHRVTLVFNRRNFTGNCIGIDPEKGLIVQLDSGARKFFDAAHTTIAK
ncbi:MAG: biotin--[acetyl-CoA-carboxylase] ligase [Planctomycetota bacterium]|jgi:BirA family biotin operon repressor/biotin-[acetyl-CoA-carboxylase] ligase